MIKETQNFLNYYIDANLVVDGISGIKTQLAIKTAISKLQSKFNESNLKWDKKFNFIGIRTNMKITNVFDDWFVLVLHETIIAVPASTKAGRPAIAKYYNRFISGVRGFGTIVENQQIKYDLVQPKLRNHWNWSWSGRIGFLSQSHGIKIYRDPNLDNTIDKSVILNNQIGGFNVHSWRGWFSTFVENLSEGCQVCPFIYWETLYDAFVKNQKNNKIIYTLIQN